LYIAFRIHAVHLNPPMYSLFARRVSTPMDPQ